MVDGYLYSNKAIEIMEGNHGRITLITRGSELGGRAEKYMINETAEEIISYIGKNVTLSEMVKELAEKYNEETSVVQEYVFGFFEDLETNYGMKIRLSDNYSAQEAIKVYNEKKIYPLGVMIELTSNCNLKCIHCYGGFEKCNLFMPYELVTKLIDQLEEMGIESVELTGGEITTHPHLYDIVRYLLNSRITRISLLTNGLLLSEEILSLIEQYPNRIIIQVDLHGLTDEYLNWFMGTTNYVERNKEIIKRVSEVAQLFRVATIVTRRNLNQIEDIADWLYANNVRHYGVSLVIPEGRAIECNEKDLFLNESELKEFDSILDRIDAKYPSFISVIDSYQDKSNCGCVSNCFSIAADGKIKMCAMDGGDTLAVSLGNVFRDNVRDVFDANQKFVEELSHVPAPTVDMECCKNCENIGYCSRCLLRAFTINSKSEYFCEWAENLPEQVKKYIKKSK